MINKNVTLIKNLMELSIALHNSQLLQKLEPYQKLIVLDNDVLEIDDRWIQSLRRTITGDSRYDIIGPIEKTFTKLITMEGEPKIIVDKYEAEVNPEKLMELLKKLRETISTTYPRFEELTGETAEDPNSAVLRKLEALCDSKVDQYQRSKYGREISQMLDDMQTTETI